MTNPKNTLHSASSARSENKLPVQQNESEITIDNFIALYNARAAFFTDAFIKKVKEGNRKALAELLRHPLPPTQMDLRQDFAKCVKALLSDDYIFSMKDGKHYTTKELKQLVPEWSLIAETALMLSDPALADKLMSPAQWNAKSAFEVIFVSAMDELRNIKKTKKISGSFDYYMKWVISPLKEAIVQVKAVNPPGNSLIGFGNRIPLREALPAAENLEKEFRKIVGEQR